MSGMLKNEPGSPTVTNTSKTVNSSVNGASGAGLIDQLPGTTDAGNCSAVFQVPAHSLGPENGELKEGCQPGLC